MYSPDKESLFLNLISSSILQMAAEDDENDADLELIDFILDKLGLELPEEFKLLLYSYIHQINEQFFQNTMNTLDICHMLGEFEDFQKNKENFENAGDNTDAWFTECAIQALNQLDLTEQILYDPDQNLTISDIVEAVYQSKEMAEEDDDDDDLPFGTDFHFDFSGE